MAKPPTPSHARSKTCIASPASKSHPTQVPHPPTPASSTQTLRTTRHERRTRGRSGAPHGAPCHGPSPADRAPPGAGDRTGMRLRGLTGWPRRRTKCFLHWPPDGGRVWRAQTHNTPLLVTHTHTQQPAALAAGFKIPDAPPKCTLAIRQKIDWGVAASAYQVRSRARRRKGAIYVERLARWAHRLAAAARAIAAH